jgi:hypothetical protein
MEVGWIAGIIIGGIAGWLGGAGWVALSGETRQWTRQSHC